MDINLNLLPKKPGVYLMKDKTGIIIYVGKAKNIHARVQQYFQTGVQSSRGWKIPSLVPLISKIDFIVAASERDALLLEDKLIKKYQPFFNSMLKDAKTYPFVKLTLQEDFPRIITTRRKEKDGALYFGPYPQISLIKNMLQFLWKNKYIPLRPCKWSFSRLKPLKQNKINGCIYYHLKQCPAPCSGDISYKNYRALVKRARLFLGGDYRKFTKELIKEMQAASKILDYESAAKLRDFLAAIRHMKERVSVSKYNPQRLEQKIGASPELKRLSEVLGSKKIIRHIEAFDNSHLYGKNPVGGIVCFIDGEKHKAHYRRLKIKMPQPKKGADDFLMMEEIVGRRIKQLKNIPKENMPDLFLIDGGPMQLEFARKAALKAGCDIEIISLAKRNEEIFTAQSKDSIRLDKSDPALLLLMRIRDEAHRFAIAYNRLLRKKEIKE
jgi:excinuclease ABC subunit C